MSEANVAREVALPWMSFGSDAAAMAPEGVFLKSSTHPRAYGNVARLLGKYVRDEGRVSLAEAVRRLSALPADNLRIADRGRLKPGNFADIAIFDPRKVSRPGNLCQATAICRRHAGTCSSTGSPCSATASIPAHARSLRAAAPAGSAALGRRIVRHRLIMRAVAAEVALVEVEGVDGERLADQRGVAGEEGVERDARRRGPSGPA